MERSSAIYKIRRKLQVMAHQICSDEFMSKVYFYIVLRKKLDLKNPKTFNEKMQWLKLYYFPKNPLVVKCSDKFAVREYIESRGYKDKLVPLIGVWNRASEIDWQSLPEKYILKATHGCGYNISYEDAQKMGEEETKKQLDKWLREDFGAFNIEPHYSQIKDKKIICEKFLGGGYTGLQVLLLQR